MLNSDLMDSIIPASFAETDARLDVFIVYDDIPAGMQAIHTMEKAIHQLGGGIELHPLLWRFDLLEDPDRRARATADALAAGMLIIASSNGIELSASFRDWVEACLTQKRGTATAVVALLDLKRNLDAPDSPRIQFLKSVTTEAGPEFFAPGMHCKETHSNVISKPPTGSFLASKINPATLSNSTGMKSKSISVSTIVDGRQETHLRALIECHGEFFVANPHYQDIPGQSALVRLDPKRIQNATAMLDTLNYTGILLEIWTLSEA